MRIYYTHVSAKQSRELEEKMEVAMTWNETEHVLKFLDWLWFVWAPLCCFTERRSCPRSCQPTLPWGAVVSSPLWGASRAAKPCWSRTSSRSTDRSARLPEALWSPNGSYSSTSTHVTLCLTMGECWVFFSFYFYLSFPNQVFCNVNIMSARCAFFPGEIDKPTQGILQRGKLKAVSVGICLEGVYVMDVKEKVSLTWSVSLWSADSATLYFSHLSLPLSLCLAARAARPALQWAFLGPQLPWGGGGLAHPVAGVWRRGRRHSCEQAAEDLLQTSKNSWTEHNGRNFKWARQLLSLTAWCWAASVSYLLSPLHLQQSRHYNDIAGITTKRSFAVK